LHWDDGSAQGSAFWQFGRAQAFSLCTRVPGTGNYITNCISKSSTGMVDTVSVGADTDEIILRLERRAAGVDFYGLAEIEVTGAAVSLPSATIPAAAKANWIRRLEIIRFAGGRWEPRDGLGQRPGEPGPNHSSPSAGSTVSEIDLS